MKTTLDRTFKAHALDMKIHQKVEMISKGLVGQNICNVSNINLYHFRRYEAL